MINGLTNRRIRYILSVGYLLVLIGILFAYNSPADSFESCIYEYTPLLYWLFITVAISISIIVSISSNNKNQVTFSLLLATIAIISIISLPLLRNYFFTSSADGISHLGFAMRVLDGSAYLKDILYPGIHTISVFLTLIINVPLNKSMMFVVIIFAFVFVLFIPLTLKTIDEKQDLNLVLLGTYSALFFLPVNLLSTNFFPYPTTQALLFSPVLIYLFIIYHKTASEKLLILYVIFFLGLLYVHPQHALGITLLFTIIVFGNKLFKNNTKFSFNIPFLSGTLFWIWSASRTQVTSNINTIFYSFFYSDFDAGADITQRGMSLSLVGGSVIEVFLKLFSLTIFFGLITLVYVFIRSTREDEKEKTNENTITLLLIGTIPIILIALIYLVLGGGAGQEQRYIGFIQVIITITGAYSFFRLTKPLSNVNKKTVFFTFLVLGLILSSTTLLPSPYVYRNNLQTTQGQYEGYETAFANYNENIKFASVRTESDRFYATINYIPRNWSIRVNFLRAPDHFNNQSLPSYYGNKTYLSISESNIIGDAELYRGFRFSYDDFDYLEQDPKINKIQSNGGFDLYLVYPREK